MSASERARNCPGTYQPVLPEHSVCIRYICDVCGDEADDLLDPEPCRRLIPLSRPEGEPAGQSEKAGQR